MIGAIITLSIIAFVLACATTLLLILFRSVSRQLSYMDDVGKRYSHLVERLTHAIEDVDDYVTRNLKSK